MKYIMIALYVCRYYYAILVLPIMSTKYLLKLEDTEDELKGSDKEAVQEGR